MTVSFAAGQKLHPQLWNQLFVTSQISKKFSIQTDAGIRFNEDRLHNNFQKLVRSMAIYKISAEWSVWMGLAYFETENQKWAVFLPEWRPVQRIQWQRIQKKTIMMVRNRLEQRFRKGINALGQETAYHFQHRFALQAQITRYINSKNTLSIVANDEFFLQTEYNLQGGYIDQNRIFFGVQNAFNKNFSLLLGPMYVIAKSDADAPPKHNLALRVNLIITL